jgi:hypothetical protein
MNEYEAAEILNGVVANAISAQAIFFTALSAYLAVAYTVGKHLSKFQVLFVNLVFILVFVSQTANQFQLFSAATHYVSVVEAMRIGVIDPVANIPTDVNLLSFTFIRSLLLLGSLLFMRSMRQAKTE